MCDRQRQRQRHLPAATIHTLHAERRVLKVPEVPVGPASSVAVSRQHPVMDKWKVCCLRDCLVSAEWCVLVTASDFYCMLVFQVLCVIW